MCALTLTSEVNTGEMCGFSVQSVGKPSIVWSHQVLHGVGIWVRTTRAEQGSCGGRRDGLHPPHHRVRKCRRGPNRLQDGDHNQVLGTGDLTTKTVPLRPEPNSAAERPSTLKCHGQRHLITSSRHNLWAIVFSPSSLQLWDTSCQCFLILLLSSHGPRHPPRPWSLCRSSSFGLRGHGVWWIDQ